MRIAISFDYDSPAGYRQSFASDKHRPDADLHGAEALLKVLSEHQVRATFAVVGHAALDGSPPEHCPGQIKEIHARGHEVASHSMYHRFIPPMTREELDEDIRQSKLAIETCIGHSIRGFIPPFNRPAHFPQRGAFSVSELLGLHGRGRGRQSIDSLVRCLQDNGFGWCRVSYSHMLRSMGAKLGLTSWSPLVQPFLLRGVVVMPLHSTGFGDASLSLARRCLDMDLVLNLYAHPNKAQGALDKSRENVERAEVLDDFLCNLRNERRAGKVQFCTMAEIETFCRCANSTRAN